MSTLREALEGAWEASSTGSDETEQAEEVTQEPEKTETPDPAPEETPPLTADAESDPPPEEPKPSRQLPPKGPDGKFIKAPKVKEPPKPEKVAEKPPAESGIAAPPPKPAAPAVKPPASWKVAEREAWAKVPPEAQAAINRREAEITRALEAAKPHRDTHDWFAQTVNPYAGMLQAEGGDVRATTASLWQTWAALRTAPPVAKAQLAANIIQTFGIDPGMIAQHLQGQPPQQQPQHLDPNQLVQRIEQQVMGRFQQQQQQQAIAHHERRLSEFEATHEYADQLRDHMAKLIETGLANDFEDAYNKAASLHPDVSQALAARQAQANAAQQRASTQRSRAASSSLKSSPAGPTGQAQGKDLRSVLDRKYDELSGQRR